MKRKDWTKEEDNTLIACYGEVSAAELAARFGCGVRILYQRARDLDLQVKAPWKPEEDKRLRNLWGEFTLPSIARRLERSPQAVYRRARRLGLASVPEGFEQFEKAVRRSGFNANKLRRILTSAGYSVRRTMNMNPRGRWLMVDSTELELAIADHLKAAPIGHYAHEYNETPGMLRRWVKRAAEQSAIPLPAPSRTAWLITAEAMAAVWAWRASLETIRDAARRAGVATETVNRRLARAGVVFRVAGRWVRRTDVDKYVIDNQKS